MSRPRSWIPAVASISRGDALVAGVLSARTEPASAATAAIATVQVLYSLTVFEPTTTAEAVATKARRITTAATHPTSYAAAKRARAAA
jgi:hypothetical protein